ncbi:MAG: S-adenosylmethionine:tRNA ribosyltransferase-isomerase [Acidimicrobiia bacterium]|nr:S-adenosylmethionine:tRNA ribosyltransferase-isomerase [Acidimicrobiia bacterium]
MIAANRPRPSAARLLVADSAGAIRHLSRSDLAALLRPGDLVVANDAATFPASLKGKHLRSGKPLEVRLATFTEAGDLHRFHAIAFGEGDYHTPTENRPLPPELASGDRLLLGPLVATVEGLLGHPRLIELRFDGEEAEILTGLARHGRPIQYAHVPDPLALWDVWTSYASRPFAFEPPSAGFALDWRTLVAWQQRGIEVATLTHAAGISSTGDPELDARLPLDEPYVIPESTALAVNTTIERGGRIVAVGTTVVRALESAVIEPGMVIPGDGVASGRIGLDTVLRVTDMVLSGIHEPGESHFELLRAFAADRVLDRVHRAAVEHQYRNHEFGDSLLLERSLRESTTTSDAVA